MCSNSQLTIIQVLNWMDNETVHVTYPLWTLKMKGMRNPLSGKTSDTIMDATRIRECIDKYRERGWTIADNSNGANHFCRVDAYCPHTQRSTHDKHTLVIRLRRFAGNSKKPAKSFVTWRMGGVPCAGADVRMRSCVSVCHCDL